jgi:hypothetical protein
LADTSPLIGVAWVLAAAGWGVSSLQANAREARKETRSEVDACCKIGADLLEKSRRFFAKEGSDPACIAEAADIKFGLRRLLTRMDRLRKQRRPFGHIMGVASDLFEVVSGADFESVKRPSYAANSSRLNEIEEATHRLIDTLESAFASEFRTWRQRVVEWNHHRKARRRGIRWQAQRFRVND